MQQNQIIPEYSFPYIKAVVNDYSIIKQADLGTNNDTVITQAYAVTSPKGIDNRWVKVVNRQEAIRLFGNSKFKEYGQPLMQALNVLNKQGAAVWFYRAMPSNATFANSFVSAFYKADTTDVSVLDRKFRIKLTASSKEDIVDKSAFEDALDAADLYVTDSEGYKQVPLFGVRYVGRGKAGNNYSLRVNQNVNYEREYGIKMFNFEMMCNDASLVKEDTQIGSIITSEKYINDDSSISVLITDKIGEVQEGYCPLATEVNEENIEKVYDAYIVFATQLHEDAVAEYETKLNTYQVPSEMLDGIVPVTDAFKEQYDELKALSSLIDATADLPELDEFDPLFGKYVADAYSTLPGIYFPEKLTDDIDTTAADFVADNYTTTDLVDFTSLKGLVLSAGSDGYFDEPRQQLDDQGNLVQLTKEEEIETALIDAFSGKYDRRIVSPRRIPITVFFDANYSYNVKKAIVNIFEQRDDSRVYLDAGIINSFSTNGLVSLSTNYGIFDSKMVSVETQNYTIREYSTRKKVDVTTTYFLSAAFIDHVREKGIETPFVRDNCILTGQIKDSLRPIVEEYDVNVKETLTTNRLNFFECRGENDFRRAVQNTTQKTESDLLEENNALVLYELKRQIENDLQSQIYNFADNSIREDFVIYETAKYAGIKGSLVEDISFGFTVSDYEFEHSILHFLVGITFRGLTKQVILEIDINKRQKQTSVEDSLDV